MKHLYHGLTHNRYYVYAYKDASRGGEVFYVGKGLGVKLSDEHKAKIAANCGRPCTEERRAKISAANKGRVFSEESLRRMSEGQKRRQQRLRDEKISR